MFGTLFDLYRQSRQGIEDKKVLRYDEGYSVEHDRDLITKETLDPVKSLVDELAPADADPLTSKVMVISGSSKKAGYLSADARHNNFKSGNAPGTQVNYIVNDGTFSLLTPDTSTAVNEGDAGLIELHLNGTIIDSFDLAAAFDEAKRDTAQTYIPANSAGSKITILSVEKYNNFKAWQKVTFRANIAAADLLRGYNAIQLVHTGIDGADQASANFDLFYDDAPTQPSLNAVSVAIHSNANAKYLSGIKYLGKNDQVKASVVGNELYDNTYVLNPIEMYGFSGAPSVSVAPTDSAVSGLSNPPAVSEVMTVADKTITLSSSNQCSADARLTNRPRDPFGTYATLVTASQNILVSTFGTSSSATNEPFDDENYRLPLTFNDDDKVIAITGQWDSTQALNNGDAQQYIVASNDHGLIFPSQDFTGHLPANTADYSGFTGNQSYMRVFLASSPKASIDLTLYGVSGGIGQIGSSDINVEIKLPTQTGWLDCAKPFDGSAGVANDGDGSMVGTINYSGGNAHLSVTFGGKSTYDANGRMYIRITQRNGNRTIKRIATNW